jgi:UDP-perosamine 4-acetyltransferase
MSPPVVIVGAGDHARVALSALRALGVEIAGWCGEVRRSAAGDPPLIGEAALLARPRDGVELVNGVGSVERPTARHAAFTRYAAAGFRFRTLIHPAAFVATEARLGEGAQAMAGAVIQAGAAIGVDALVNTGALVDHDALVGAHSHVATGARLAGAVELGEGCHVGAGAVVIQYVRIGAGSLIGAGAVVVRDVPAGATAIGVPARLRPTAAR